MKKTRSKNKSSRLSRIASMIVCGLIVAVATWLTIRVITMNSDLMVETAYQIPELTKLDNLPRLDSGAYAVVVDGETVAGQKSQEIHPTASMAKMILALAIMQEKPFELGETGETITITDEYYQIYKNYVENGGSVSAVEAGEEISEYDALVSVMLPSSNNMADTLAIWAFGSLVEYQDYANEMLKKWGLNNTTVGVDASGFDPSTTSTASDMAKIGTRVMQQPVLKEIVGLQEHKVPVAGVLANTNKLLGQSNISGVKTGYIGDVSGYCLTSGYLEGEHTVTMTLMGATSRESSFGDSLAIIETVQEEMPLVKLVSRGDTVGYYDSWWNGNTQITANDDVYGLGWDGAATNVSLEMAGQNGNLKITIGSQTYNTTVVTAEEYKEAPSLLDRVRHAFGWSNDAGRESSSSTAGSDMSMNTQNQIDDPNSDEVAEMITPITNAPSANCTIKLGALMLVNPNFTVENEFINARRGELVSISSLYGIVEGNPGNGDNLLDAEAATHINDMVKAYETEYPGHTMETRSCFRAVGTNCGRLCAATGTSDHHTGLTCDLLDPAYGAELDADTYAQHLDWQWLKANSYRYGFIDRFPEAWAGGSMSESINVDENGTTGLYETWHYRYVGVDPATEIATGKYNNGEYDSLEHYLKMRGFAKDLKAGKCE